MGKKHSRKLDHTTKVVGEEVNKVKRIILLELGSGLNPHSLINLLDNLVRSQ